MCDNMCSDCHPERYNYLERANGAPNRSGITNTRSEGEASKPASSETVTKPLTKFVDGHVWFTDLTNVNDHIERVKFGIMKEYSLFRATGHTGIAIRIQEAVPLLGVKEYFDSQGIKLTPCYTTERLNCKCDSDIKIHAFGCTQTGYLVYFAEFQSK